MFELKKYRGVIFHDTREWCKIQRKTDLWFEKSHEESGKYSSEHIEVSKCHENEEWCKIWREIYRGFMFDGTENWYNIWRKTDFCFLKWDEELDKLSFTGWKMAISL